MKNEQNEVHHQRDGTDVHCAHDAMVDVTELVPNPRNPNKHGDKQIALLAKIIRHQGWRAPIVVSNRSGFIVAGHGRLEAAKLLGIQTVPVNRQDFETEADEWAHLVADNKIAELADSDYEGLSALLHELKDVDGFDLDLLGMEPHDLEVLLAADWKPEAEGDLNDTLHNTKTIHVTAEQHGVILRAVEKLRADEQDKEASEGRCLELICADYLA